jgi:hypothetical protein
LSCLLACAHSPSTPPSTRSSSPTKPAFVSLLCQRPSLFYPPPLLSLLPTAAMVEKRPSTDGLVDNIDGLPTYEKPAEPAPSTFKAKLITCLWIALNTFSTLGLIFLSKR